MKFTKNIKKIISLLTIIITFFSLFSSTYSKKNPLTVFTKRTPNADWGSNNIHNLDKHDIKCDPNQALQGFRLFRANSNNLSYKYACTKNIAGNNVIDAKTPINDVAKDVRKSANFLERHNVQCQKGYALQEFKLNSQGKQIFYSYRCVNVNCGENQTLVTKGTDDGGYETVYLDRQDVRVKTNEVITGFKLSGGKNRDYYYEIKFCKLGKGAPVSKPVVQPVVVKEMSAKEKGERFCAENCQMNISGKRKYCILNKVSREKFICRRCSIKSGLIDNDKKSICETFCDASESGDNKQCIFYGFMNNLKKKNFDINVLNKFGLKVRRR